MAEHVDGELLLQPLLLRVHDGLGSGDAGIVDQNGRWC